MRQGLAGREAELTLLAGLIAAIGRDPEIHAWADARRQVVLRARQG